MNKWFGCGRLTRDPEARTYNETKTMARFSIAVNDTFRNNDGNNEAIFVPVTAFGGQADFALKYLRQGTKVIVEGRLQLGSYVNKEGNRVNTTDIICERIEFAESKNANNTSREETAAVKPQETDSDGFMTIPDTLDDEELPWN